MLGFPNDWDEGIQLASKMSFTIPENEPSGLPQKIQTASPQCIDLLRQMLEMNPEDRITADEIL